jgi:hypothetical protein
MLEFLELPANHSQFDDVEIEYDIRNDKNRTPLMLCFTPPTATYIGLKFGVDKEGKPIAVKPDGIENPGRRM